MHILVSVVIIVSVMAYFFYASYSIRACIYMRVFCCKKTEEKIIAINIRIPSLSYFIVSPPAPLS